MNINMQPQVNNTFRLPSSATIDVSSCLRIRRIHISFTHISKVPSTYNIIFASMIDLKSHRSLCKLMTQNYRSRANLLHGPRHFNSAFRKQ